MTAEHEGSSSAQYVMAGEVRHPPRESFDDRYDGPFARRSLTSGRCLSLSLAGNVHTLEGTTYEALGASQSDLDIPAPGVAHVQHKNFVLGDAPAAASRPAPSAIRQAALEPIPPPLNYNLRGRRSGIALFVFYTFLDSLLLPVGLYFLLWYGLGPGNPKYHPLSASTVLTIVTTAIGGASIYELLLRAWRLWKKNSDCRVIGARRWYFDWFEWWFVLGWILIIIEIVVYILINGVEIRAFLPDEPDKRLLAMPLSTVLFIFGTVSLSIDILHYLSVPAPVRMSSIPRGAQLRPGIYPLIEDICAVDGSGQTEFRRNLNRRYAASHVFRTMLRRLGLFWAVGADVCAFTTAALVFGLADDNLIDYAYTIGWVLPFVWAGPSALATVFYVKGELKKEKRLWAMEFASRSQV
ncbi:hypothetical protein PG993_008985 [Apiospora rasikravindrae]|uniref:Uncharacterized protein n=1 Tax=Apiospora rasikravindrae TaxID=990691 RepID=A0ABR1SI36_9PEZI